MDSVSGAWLSGLVLGTTYLTTVYKTEFAFNIPYHLACITLALTGLLLIAVSFISARVGSNPAGAWSAAYIPLHDGQKSPKPSDVRSLRSLSEPMRPAAVRGLAQTQRNMWALFIGLILVVCARLELARNVLKHIQCANAPYAPAFPLLIALAQLGAGFDYPAQPFLAAHRSSLLWRVASSRWRNIIPALFLTWGAYLVLGLFPGLRSTYICPLASPLRYMIPRIQLLGSLLDILIITILDRMISRTRDLRRLPPVQRLADLGWAALTTYMLLTTAGLFSMLPINRYWYTQMPFVYMMSAVKVGAVFALVILSALQTYRRLGVVSTSYVTFFVAINVTSWRIATTSHSYELPVSFFKIAISISFIYAGFLLYLAIDSAGSNHLGSRFQGPGRMSRRLLAVLAILYVAQLFVWSSVPAATTGQHPIPTLLREAEASYQRWLGQAGQSKTVAEAAKEYRKRYKRDPPPRFDKWFQFAMNRSSLVIDDFDSLHANVLPFWSLSPGDIRLRAFESISNNWNWIGGIQIRKGKISTTPHVPVTHQWMLESMQKMIGTFAEHLPDMDIPFNLNDEPRSAVYFHEMQYRLHVANNERLQLPTRDDGDFHPDRSWIPVPQESIEETRYRDATFRNTFHTYGSAACPPSSRARRERHWDRRVSCAECKAEHSLGAFVANWSEAADPCHQPDLADSYGLHLSPAQFKGTNELMPVFSQSATHGYSDLLIPSPWNYAELSVYAPTTQMPDPPFDEKETTLFWRGKPTDGMSVGSGMWRGMMRQRLIHMVNNATDAAKALVYLPSTYPSAPNDGNDAAAAAAANDAANFKQHLIKPSVLRKHLATSLGFVGFIPRCGWGDCPTQEAEFQPGTRREVHFQEHWRYKFLMDVDGAGFSGRFIPFLQSGSLPFKASLSREWWAPRVFAWKHFVPVDVRFAELWSLLAWFAGFPAAPLADETARRWVLRPHTAEAAKIAADGQRWANRVLRKEDMEIYMFRLLLEYGRLTDERRDELGWMGDRDG